MAKKEYDWVKGVPLEDHTKRKHKILREYLFQYIAVRCRIPQQEKFRLAIVDGFAGGGRYKCGTGGSPLIFIEELQRALEAVNIQRSIQGLGSVDIECALIFNEVQKEALGLLKDHCSPLLAEARERSPKLNLIVYYFQEEFEEAYKQIQNLIAIKRYRSVLYNLDQCGHAQVSLTTLAHIMRSANSVEVFYTFAIESLLAFLSKTNREQTERQLRHLGVSGSDLDAVERYISNSTWLGAAEKIVFNTFAQCARYVSPFSIHNPSGWRYWLIHFANSYRARQVYNDVLHENASSQAHFGRSGLDMLAYDPSDEAKLYLFDDPGRAQALAELRRDIPKLVSDSGDALTVNDFYEEIYNATPAHKDDIHSALIENPDLEIVTPMGGLRQKATAISIEDTIKLKQQKSFFPLFFAKSQKN